MLSSSLSQKIQDWLDDSSKICFQLTSKDFKLEGLQPRKMIPTYSRDDIPQIFVQYGLEHFRNLSGGCILIKKEKFNLPTLFPILPKPKCQEDLKIKWPANLRLLKHFDLHNEETGIVLVKELRLLQTFFETQDEFTLLGRVKTSVNGNLIINEKERHRVEKVPIEKCQLEVDNSIESSYNVISIEAKFYRDKPRESFSIHQFALPTLLFSMRTEKLLSSILLEYSPLENNALNFRIFHYMVKHDRGTIYPHEYQLKNSAEFRVEIY